jgi:dihydrofolate reductase
MKTISPTICSIVAIGPDNVIGRDGVMPWYCASDFYHFRKTTTPYPCIFGRVTFENLPIKPLPGRLNIVCSSSYKNEFVKDVFCASSIESAIDYCAGSDKVFICGGVGVYKYVFDKDLTDILYISIIKNLNLSRDIKKNPGAYCRFPIQASEFLNCKKWASERIIYPDKELPIDKNNTVAEFYKCVRVR